MKKLHVIDLTATEHPSAHEAIQHLSVSGDDYALLIGGRYLTLKKEELAKIGAYRVEFAFLIDHHGRIMTIPAGGR